MRGRVVRSLAFRVDALPASLRVVLAEFRLLVNRSIRIALREDIRSRARLTKVAYRMLSAEHDIYKQYIPCVGIRPELPGRSRIWSHLHNVVAPPRRAVRGKVAGRPVPFRKPLYAVDAAH